MKRLIAVLCASMSIGLMPLASCSFFNTDQALQIKSVTHDSDENGNVIVTITYTDEEATPTKFILSQLESRERKVLESPQSMQLKMRINPPH